MSSDSNVTDMAIGIDASTSHTYIYFIASTGVYKSSNSGQSFTPLNMASNFTFPARVIAIAPDVPNIVVVSDAKAVVYQSSDGGTNWSTLDSPCVGGGNDTLTDLAISPIKSGDRYVFATIADNAVNKTKKGDVKFIKITGGKWTPVANVSGTYDYMAVRLSPNFAQDNIICVVGITWDGAVEYQIINVNTNKVTKTVNFVLAGKTTDFQGPQGSLTSPGKSLIYADIALPNNFDSNDYTKNVAFVSVASASTQSTDDVYRVAADSTNKLNFTRLQVRSGKGVGIRSIAYAGDNVKGTLLAGEDTSTLVWNSPTPFASPPYWCPVHNALAVGDKGQVLQYNGSSWSSWGSVNTKALQGVWGTSMGSFFLVGDNVATYCFTSMQVKGLAGTIYGVWGVDESNVFIVGENGFISRYDAKNWSQQTLPSAFSSVCLNGVWGSSRDDVFVMGDVVVGSGSTILHWDGKSWSQITLPAGFPQVNLNGVWGSSRDDIFVVGDVVVGSGSTILHWDGKSWSQITLPAGFPQVNLNGVWGSSRDDVFVVGDVVVGSGSTILHWDGKSWSQITLPARSSQVNLYGVWGKTSDDFFVVGDIGTILHWDGKSWNTMSNSNIQKCLFGVWGPPPPSGQTNAVVGMSPNFLNIPYCYAGTSGVNSGLSKSGDGGFNFNKKW